MDVVTEKCEAEVDAFIQTHADDNEAQMLERETRCGLGPWRPVWLQCLASKKSFVIVYGLIGMGQFALASYFVATISTMEKRFKIPSQTSGLITAAWDFGVIGTSILFSYLGRTGHKPHWVAWGTVCTAFSCYLRLLPHWLYGPGEDALALTVEFGAAVNASQSDTSPSLPLCGSNYSSTENCGNASAGDVSAIILFTAHVLLGVGNSVYYTLGISYMDDNAHKNKAPMMLAVWQCLRMLGPTIGFLMASYALELYVAPDLTPTIDSNDPRWMGAWWFGWNPFGLVTLLMALMMAMFPRTLPRAVKRNVDAAAARGISHRKQPEQTQLSFKDFKMTMKRLVTNKLLVCNTISSTFFVFGMMGQFVFMPKYMETQFRQSASTASLITGSIGLLCSAAGVLLSGAVISRYKPGPRLLAGWNVLVEFCDMLGFVVMIYIGCESINLHGNPQPDGTMSLDMDCNKDCGCSDVLRYSPTCDPVSKTTFFSPCHAGCSSLDRLNATKSFSSCTCVDGRLIDGLCPADDCNNAFLLFIIINCIQLFFSATGRAGNTLLHFRCVSSEDKPVSIGISEFLLCLFAFIPAPIVFGVLIDMSCLVWGYTCGETGNCLMYDVDMLRLYMNIPIVAVLLLGTLWDVAVWYYAKGLELYDNDQVPEKITKQDNNLNSNYITPNELHSAIS